MSSPTVLLGTLYLVVIVVESKYTGSSGASYFTSRPTNTTPHILRYVIIKLIIINKVHNVIIKIIILRADVIHPVCAGGISKHHSLVARARAE